MTMRLEEDPAFGEQMKVSKGTMFYICKGACLCGIVDNRGKVIYCYGEFFPRHGDLFQDEQEYSRVTNGNSLLAAQIGIYIVGILAILIVLILIKNSLSSLHRHVDKVTDFLPSLYDSEDMAFIPHRELPHESPPDETVLPVTSDEEPPHSEHGHEENTLHLSNNKIAGPGKSVPVEKLKTLRIHRKDFKKGGEGLRGKNVTENFRIKEKDMKRTMK